MSLRQQFENKLEEDAQRILSLVLRLAMDPSPAIWVEAKAILASMHNDIPTIRIFLSEDEDIEQRKIEDLTRDIRETKENIQDLRRQLHQANDNKDFIMNKVYHSIQECLQLSLQEDQMQAKLKTLREKHQTFINRLQKRLQDLTFISTLY